MKIVLFIILFVILFILWCLCKMAAIIEEKENSNWK